MVALKIVEEIDIRNFIELFTQILLLQNTHKAEPQMQILYLFRNFVYNNYSNVFDY